jgi:cell division transport system ATP-binding protein
MGQAATAAQAPTVMAVPSSANATTLTSASAQSVAQGFGAMAASTQAGGAAVAAPAGAHANHASTAATGVAATAAVVSGTAVSGVATSAGVGVAASAGAPANTHAHAPAHVSAPAAPAVTGATVTTAASNTIPAATATQLESSRPDLKAIPVPAATPAATPDSKTQSSKGAGRTAGRQVSGSIPVILFDSVSKIYSSQPNKPALSNVSLKIQAGEFIFLVGHSGSGKSTFIRLINREILASKGRLTVAGEDVIRMRNWRVPYLRRNIGCVFQDFKLLPNKTAFDNVAFALEVIGKSKHIIRTQVPEVLRLVGLEDKLDKYPDQLSGGEQQRVSIARAIVNRPPLLICDEPTGNLDPQTSLGIMRLLDRINRTGTTILVATHDREMVDSLRKRVVALENGYLVRDQDKGVYGLDA